MYLTHELKETLTFILAGGQGERLKPLTIQRAKPAVPFGGSYRIIDFTRATVLTHVVCGRRPTDSTTM